MSIKKPNLYLLCCVLLCTFGLNSQGKSKFVNHSDSNHSNQETESNNLAVAINDTFEFFIGCENDILCGSVLSNDNIPDTTSTNVCAVYAPEIGTLSFGNGGKFTFTLDNKYTEEIIFTYRLCDNKTNNYYSEAKVLILIKKDNDCDNVADDVDLDNDNDGILDSDEGNGKIDSDDDGVPDNLDIDSDNDGITDIVEWQKEGSFSFPIGIDINKNGWDDAFDSLVGGVYYKQEDTNNNGIPDYIDSDSDNDGIPDNIEGDNSNLNGIPELVFQNMDSDNDGLDDAYDTILKGADRSNSYGSCSSLPDKNNNGIRDWREAQFKSIPGEPNPFDLGENLFVYPNPSAGKFFINIPSSIEKEEIRVQIYNLNGVLALEKQISRYNYFINTGYLQSGIYIVKLMSPTVKHTERLRIIK